jgi:hypothetical protein
MLPFPVSFSTCTLFSASRPHHPAKLNQNIATQRKLPYYSSKTGVGKLYRPCCSKNYDQPPFAIRHGEGYEVKEDKVIVSGAGISPNAGGEFGLATFSSEISDFEIVADLYSTVKMKSSRYISPSHS